MLYSMTGYGKAVVKLPSRDITIEIKSLNSKQLDLSVKIPSVYNSIDGRIRSKISKLIERGKVEFFGTSADYAKFEKGGAQNDNKN